MDSNQIVDAIRKALAPVPAVLYEGQIPTKLPTDTGGYISPYMVLWLTQPTDLAQQRPLTQLMDMDVTDQRFQITCVGPNTSTCLALVNMARYYLANLPIGRGYVKTDPDGFTNTVEADNQVTPARFYLPLHWRLTTT